MPKFRRRLLVKLFQAAKGECYYCGIMTDINVNIALADHGYSLPPWAGTIEHLYPKYDIRRMIQKRQYDNTVLCCYECNQERDQSFKHLCYNTKIEYDDSFSLIGLLENKFC